MTEKRILKPITREIILKLMVFSMSFIWNPLFVCLVVTFFQGAKSVLSNTDTEKKYGRKMKMFFNASKKFCVIVDFVVAIAMFHYIQKEWDSESTFEYQGIRIKY